MILNDELMAQIGDILGTLVAQSVCGGTSHSISVSRALRKKWVCLKKGLKHERKKERKKERQKERKSASKNFFLDTISEKQQINLLSWHRTLSNLPAIWSIAWKKTHSSRLIDLVASFVLRVEVYSVDERTPSTHVHNRPCFFSLFSSCKMRCVVVVRLQNYCVCVAATMCWLLQL